MRSTEALISIVVAVVAAFVVGCDFSDQDDRDQPAEAQPTVVDLSASLYPLVVGNFWQYERTIVHPDGPVLLDTITTTVTADSMVVVDSSQVRVFVVRSDYVGQYVRRLVFIRLMNEEDDGVVWYDFQQNQTCGFGWFRRNLIPMPWQTGIRFYVPMCDWLEWYVYGLTNEYCMAPFRKEQCHVLEWRDSKLYYKPGFGFVGQANPDSSQVLRLIDYEIESVRTED